MGWGGGGVPDVLLAEEHGLDAVARLGAAHELAEECEHVLAPQRHDIARQLRQRVLALGLPTCQCASNVGLVREGAKGESCAIVAVCVCVCELSGAYWGCPSRWCRG